MTVHVSPDKATGLLLPGLGGLPFVPKAPAVLRGKFRDAMQTFDRNTIDSTGVFLVSELERLDQTLHMPLSSVSWTRDIDLREDVSMGDEMSSFTNSTFASMGGMSPGGKAWISKDQNIISGPALDIGKTISPLTLWGQEVKWSLPELASAEQLGRPIDSQKYEAMKLKWNLDMDEMVYTGDTALNVKGLFNNASITPVGVAASASGNGPQWIYKSPEEILIDFNTALTSTWANAAWAVMPNRAMIPPTQYGYLTTTQINLAGDRSILKYLNENNIVTQSGGELEILPQKWLIGLGGGEGGVIPSTADRMVLYTKDKNRVRMPMVPIQRTPIEYRSLYQITTYYCRIGVVEVVYPELISYWDGI